MSSPAPPPLPPRPRPDSSVVSTGLSGAVATNQPGKQHAAEINADPPATTPYTFKLPRALLAFVLPMPAFLQLPANRGVEVMVGVVVVRKMPEYGEEGRVGGEGEGEGDDEEKRVAGQGHTAEVEAGLGGEKGSVDGTGQIAARLEAEEGRVAGEKDGDAVPPGAKVEQGGLGGGGEVEEGPGGEKESVDGPGQIAVGTEEGRVAGEMHTDVVPHGAEAKHALPAAAAVGTASSRTPPSPPQPGAVLLRRLASSTAPAPSSTAPAPSFADWDIPTARIKRGSAGDTTLLETVARCVREQLGGEVKEMVRLLGVSNRSVPVDADGLMEDGKKPKHAMARRYDFLVRLYPSGAAGSAGSEETGATDGLRPRKGWEMRWVDTEEVWRVMRRLPPEPAPAADLSACVAPKSTNGARNVLEERDADEEQATAEQGATTPRPLASQDALERDKAEGGGVSETPPSV